MFSEGDVRRGRILASAFFLNQYRTSDQELTDKGLLGIQLAYVWGAEKYGWAFVFKAATWTAKRGAVAAFTTSYGLAVSVPVIIGGAASVVIDGEEGLFNYVDFLEDVVTLDDEGIVDKLTFTWDTLILGKNRKEQGVLLGGSIRDFKNKVAQINTDRDYRRANPEKFTWYKDPVTGWTA